MRASLPITRALWHAQEHTGSHSLGWTFAVLVLVAGRCIARRKYYAFCFVMACVECLSVPFGTVLGVFTILVLNRASVRELFHSKAA